MSVTDQLIHITVRIDCLLKDGSSACGTGFIFNFCKKGNSSIPALVTNKHVIKDAVEGNLTFTLADKDNKPQYGKTNSFKIINFEQAWVAHKEKKVDLAAYPIGTLLQTAAKSQKKIYYKSLEKDHIADDAFLKELNAVEEILMVGYPDGLWDSANNLPICRAGITATPPFIDYEKAPIFIIDCACFTGSSGSPVFLANQGSYAEKDGSVKLGSRYKLLGILFAGPQQQAEGEVKVIPIPTASTKKALIKMPINLGYCIKAEQLLFFEDYFEKEEKKRTAS